jgi:hypothetical protein
MITIVNNTNKEIYIEEIHKYIPSGDKIYVLPTKIAYKYAINGMIRIVHPEIDGLKNDVQNLTNDKNMLISLVDLMQRKNDNHIERFDVVYPFDFDEEHIEQALYRLNWSLKSIVKQNVNICVYVTSQKCIKKRIKYPVNYIHNPIKQEYYNRSKTINLAVKDFVKSKYFLVSDIDLIYHHDFIHNVSLVVNEKDKPLRIIFYNVNLNEKCQIDNPTYENCKQIWDSHYSCNPNCRNPEHGLSMVPFNALGNGIFQLKSFTDIGGFCEKFIGWGPEDHEMLHRISKTNEVVYINKEGFNTFHLYHPHKQFEKEYDVLKKKNDEIYNKIIKD